MDAAAEGYRLIFENAPVGLLSFDEHGIIRACNNRFFEIIGSSREKPIGLHILALRDVKLVQALRDSEEKFRLVFSHSNDGLLIADSEGKVSDWN